MANPTDDPSLTLGRPPSRVLTMIIIIFILKLTQVNGQSDPGLASGRPLSQVLKL